jgi:hypothetical protein
MDRVPTTPSRAATVSLAVPDRRLGFQQPTQSTLLTLASLWTDFAERDSRDDAIEETGRMAEKQQEGQNQAESAGLSRACAIEKGIKWKNFTIA